MENRLELAKGVYCVGVQDWDRRLFDELIPLPDGTSYNSYMVKGKKKNALIDAVDPAKSSALIDNIIKAGVDRIDYVVANHAEQDHSGGIVDILMLYPEAKVVTNPKCKGMLIDLLEIEEDRFVEVEDGEQLELGGKKLEFVYTPWVHWPETMGTYLAEDKIYFSCDLFGSHLATSSIYVEDRCRVYEAAKRYYAEIMMPFRPSVKKNLEKLGNYDISVIAPSHGPVYREPEFIIEAYKEWVSDTVKNEVVIAFVSMHESTRRMIEYFTEAVIERGISVQQYDLSVTDIGKLAMSLVDAATIVIGTPTVLGGAHPKACYAAMVANALNPKTRFAGLINSYGWGGQTASQVKSLLGRLKVEFLEPIQIKGAAKNEDYLLLDKLADEIAEKHKSIGIL